MHNFLGILVGWIVIPTVPHPRPHLPLQKPSKS